LEQGTAPEEIAILVRANNDIRDIAAHFMQVRPQLKLVSDEAFRLDASLSVNILIAALRLISHPEDKLVKAQLVKDYQQQVLGNKITDAELFIDTNLDSLLPEGFSCTDLQTMPVMDLIDHLYRLFELHRITNQSAYVCAFYDVLATFLHDNVASIEHFLNEWDENLYKKTIQSDESDGIRIISIHKSKGLEFPHVIIPLCDWQLERSDTIWCEKKTEDPYDKLPIIPIDFSKAGMMGTVYEKDYTEEHLQNVVDNMNLLYVAFTRAGKSLFVMGKRMSKKRKDDKKKTVTSANRSEVIEDCLPKLAETFLDSFLTGADDEKEPLVFEWGVLPEIETKKEKKTENVFLTPYEEHMVNIETFKTTVGFRQSNKSREFVNGDDEEQTSSISYIKLGNILHALFSTIETTADI
jgi:ATP-dependent exoDNAse (exonuclease V) beta subunit